MNTTTNPTPNPSPLHREGSTLPSGMALEVMACMADGDTWREVDKVEAYYAGDTYHRGTEDTEGVSA